MEKEKNENTQISRRGFMGVVGTASAGVILGCSKDKNPTKPNDDVDDQPTGDGTAQVAVSDMVFYDHNALKVKIGEMLDKLGGLGDLVKSGDTVGMKINLTGGPWAANKWKAESGANPEDSFWTHPKVITAIGELCLDAGAGKIYILESYDDGSVITRYGYNQAASRIGAEVVNTNLPAPYSNYVTRPVGNNFLIYKNIYQHAVFDELDCFISLPKAKQHISAGVTHAMKNLVGTLPQPRYSHNGSSNRWAIHSHDDKYEGNANSNLGRVVCDLNSATKIHLAVNDVIKTTVGGEGPWCSGFKNAMFNKLVVSKDVVAADTITTQVMGFNPNAADYTDTFALPDTPCINYLREAEKVGLGVNDLEKIAVFNV